MREAVEQLAISPAKEACTQRAKKSHTLPSVDEALYSPQPPLSADDALCSLLQSRNTSWRVVLALMQSPRAYDICTRVLLIQEAWRGFLRRHFDKRERNLNSLLGWPILSSK